MKKILFILSIIILFSCGKEEKIKTECWTCTDKYGVETFRTWQTCDVLEVTRDNGKRWHDIYGWHYITCQ